MPLFGRDAEIDQVVSASGRLVLVTGDRGVGKSTVLTEAQSWSGATSGVGTEPVLLRREPGSLQQGLLNALGAAVALLAQDAGATHRIGRHLVDAARRLGQAKLDDLPSAVGRFLLGVVRQKVGDEVADLIRDYSEQLRTSVDERLSARIEAASDKGVVDIVVEFSREVAELAAGRQVILALDGGERLRRDDLDRLADLIELLPKGIQIRIAFAASDVDEQDHVDELQSAGATVIGIGGLDTTAVERWLVSEDLPTRLVPQIMRVTGGYALHVQDAIALLHQGEDLSQWRGREVVAANTKKTFRALDLFRQLVVTQLVALSDPPPSDWIADFLGIETFAWHVLENSLRQLGVFSVQSNGRLWFHELRRRYLWDEVLTEEERLECAEKVVRSLLATNLPLNFAVEVARLIPLAPRVLDGSPHAQLVAAAPAEELAILAAAVELVEPANQPSIIDADTLLLHARETFELQGDLAAALRSLHEKGLVRVVSEGEVGVVIPTWAGDYTGPLIGGRTARELGRLPLPQVASLTFNELRLRLGDLEKARFGVGQPDIAHLSKMADDLRFSRDSDGRTSISSSGSNLLLRANLGTVPFYAAIRYDNVAHRDSAYHAVSDLRAALWGNELTVTCCFRHPGERVRSRRFLRVIEDVTRKSLHASQQIKIDRAISLDEELELEAKTLALVRRLSSPLERFAMRLDEPIELLYHGEETSSLIAEVYGREGYRRLERIPETNWRSPFFRFELARAAGLGPTERVGLISERGGPRSDDPVVYTVGRLAQRAVRFNSTQRRIEVPIDETALADLLTEASKRLANDIAAFINEVPISMALSRRDHGNLAMLVIADNTQQRWMGLSHSVIYGHFEGLDSDDNRAFVKVLRREPENVAKAFSDAFGLDSLDEDLPYLGHGDAEFVLAQLLGYSASDLYINYE